MHVTGQDGESTGWLFTRDVFVVCISFCLDNQTKLAGESHVTSFFQFHAVI